MPPFWYKYWPALSVVIAMVLAMILYGDAASSSSADSIDTETEPLSSKAAKNAKSKRSDKCKCIINHQCIQLIRSIERHNTSF